MFLYPPLCVHRDRRPDLTVSGAHSPRFVLFVFLRSFYLIQSVWLCLSRGKEVAARNPAIAHCKTAWEFGVGVRRDRCECRESVGRDALMPAAGGGSPKPAGWFPGCRSPGCRSPRRAVRGRSSHQNAADSMPAGPPLTQCPPARL